MFRLFGRGSQGSALLIVGLLSACSAEPPPAPVLEIPVMEVIQRDTELTMDLVGQTRGSTDVPIRARVQGFLESQEFKEGRRVSQGQLLYTIDPEPFLAKIVEAEGRVASAKTRLAKAKADLERIRPLAAINAVSKQDLDSAVAMHDAAVGDLQASTAQLEQAQIEFSYTRIHSPTDGLIGISRAEVGEFVGSAPNAIILNYVSLTDPIRVRFSINEREYLRLARLLATARQEGRASGRQESTLQLILADGSLHPYKGKITAFDAAVNPTMGTFTLEADFPNPDNIVLAGQFARVRAIVDVREDALLIPMLAVSELQGLFRVFVVADDGTVELRFIELGPQVGRLRIVESGLEQGERVAVDGLLRLTDGMKVQPRLVEPSAEGDSLPPMLTPEDG